MDSNSYDGNNITNEEPNGTLDEIEALTSGFQRGYEIADHTGLAGMKHVVVCKEKDTNTEFVAKFLPVSRLTNMELRTLSACQGIPGVVRVVECFKETMVGPGDRDIRKEWVVLIMEKAKGGDLFDRVSQKVLNESECKAVIISIARTLVALHDLGIIHRDVKLENLLLPNNHDQKDQLSSTVLCDFGFATDDTSPKEPVFTPSYCAPEILKCYSKRQITGEFTAYTSAVDIWCLGVTLYVLVTGAMPFYTLRRNVDTTFPPDLKNQILTGQYMVPQGVSRELTNLLEGMLEVNPSKRLTAIQVLNLLE